MRLFRCTRAAALIVAPCLLALGLGISYAASSEIARPVQGGVTIFAVPIQASADVNRDGVVNHLDSVDITRKLNTPTPLTRLDVPLSGGIQGIGFDPPDNTLYYTDDTGRVRHIRRDGFLLGSFQTKSGGGLTVQGGYVWADIDGVVFKHNKLTGAFTGVSFKVGHPGLAFDEEHKLLWTGHWNDGRFRGFDLDTGERVFESAL